MVDCDCVMADLIGRVLRFIEEQTGKTYTNSMVYNAWRIAEAVGQPELNAAVRHELETRPGFAAEIEPFPEAIEFVDRLRRISDVFAVTAPLVENPTWVYDRYMWLMEHFAFPKNRIIMASDKTPIDGDVFIDDDLKRNILPWAETHPSSLGIVWSGSSGQDHSEKTLPHNVIEAHDWETVWEAVTMHLKLDSQSDSVASWSGRYRVGT